MKKFGEIIDETVTDKIFNYITEDSKKLKEINNLTDEEIVRYCKGKLSWVLSMIDIVIGMKLNATEGGLVEVKKGNKKI